MYTDSERIGNTIRTFRKAKGITLEKMAEMICKSKSTVGKYEQGIISVEVTVLLDLARALEVSPAMLLAGLEKPNGSSVDSPNSSGTRRYLYSYDGFSRKILRALLVVALPDKAESPVSLFYDISSFDAPEHCRVLYCGHLERHETFSKYLIHKQGGIESPEMVFCRPLDYQGKESGVFFGISSRTQKPVMLKCILSDSVLHEDAELIEQLKISSEDLRIARKTNQFMPELFI